MIAPLISVALLAASSAQALSVPRHHQLGRRQDDLALKTYVQGLLEPYSAYSERYNSYGCTSQKSNTDFFDQCCKPRAPTDTSNLDSCASTAASLAAAATEVASSTSDFVAPTSDFVPTSSEFSDAERTQPASSSDYVPQTSSSAAYTPEPSSEAQYTPESSSDAGYTPAPTTYEAPTTTSEAAPATTSASSGSTSGEGYSGTATYYYQNGAAGACGEYKSDSDFIVAIPILLWGDYNSRSSMCGKTVTMCNAKTNNCVDAVVADLCPTCVGDYSIDLSDGLFKALAAGADGVFDTKYYIH
ncbi:hypothetical protein CYLTODRAFT_486555 [Cylindrobasidium torrendii FP15055 ss-10]|uniref:Expansin-like EG45 domain-containing protein n=1 Tax=Cylindrobasidium torrendii FP15055 ss-10 TaxID=1314674 RepID=A0A0D7BPP1_9AGAR|nr:hypothetical protein CYLTODRAFT_486555 [Cylindrobasidium torrendii FP15055 ss-10]